MMIEAVNAVVADGAMRTPGGAKYVASVLMGERRALHACTAELKLDKIAVDNNVLLLAPGGACSCGSSIQRGRGNTGVEVNWLAKYNAGIEGSGSEEKHQRDGEN